MNRRNLIKGTGIGFGTLALTAAGVGGISMACSACKTGRVPIRLSWDPTDPHYDEHLCRHAVVTAEEGAVGREFLNEVIHADERVSTVTYTIYDKYFEFPETVPWDKVTIDLSKCDPHKVYAFITKNKFHHGR